MPTLAPQVGKFLPHCEANLVATDISPMDCINAIFKDNFSNCAGVDVDAAYVVVRLCAEAKVPRMLRFLSNLIEPKGRVIVANQSLVVRALDTKEGALLLMTDDEGRKELDWLIETNDHIVHSQGLT
jgi:hypothetical protein